MKKLIAIMLLCMMIVLVSGCVPVATVESVDDASSKKSMFVKIEETDLWHVVYCKETKVMYVVSYGNYNYGTFTMLVNADGTPMLYDGE